MADVSKEVTPLNDDEKYTPSTRSDFEEFFISADKRISDKTKAVMMEVCQQIAVLDE